MVLGIRPESLSYSQDGGATGGEDILNVTVGVVEPLGDKMDLHVQTPTHDRLGLSGAPATGSCAMEWPWPCARERGPGTRFRARR